MTGIGEATRVTARRGVPAVPAPGGPRPLARRKGVLIAIVAVLGAMAYLGYVAFNSAAMYYLTVGEVLAKGPEATSKTVRVAGRVVPISVQNNPETNTLSFSIVDKDNPDGGSLPVVYTGVIPDAFKTNADVVLEGKLTEGGTFQARNLLVRCPSKYQARRGDGSQADGEHSPEHHTGEAGY